MQGPEATLNMPLIRMVFWIAVSLQFAGCSNLLYYPTRNMYTDLESLPIKPKQVEFKTSKGVRLIAWYFQSPTQKALPPIVVFHGNGQNLSAHFQSLYWILEHGASFLIFDYPGYGGSEGDSDPENTVDAGLAAIQLTQNLTDSKSVVLIGQSLGGAIALRTAMELPADRIHSIVIESSFASYRRVAQSVLAKHWSTWAFQPLAWVVLSDRYAPSGKFEKLPRVPVLVLHRREDEIVPFYLGQELYESILSEKEFIALEGRGHIDAFTGPDQVSAREQLLKFLKLKK